MTEPLKPSVIEHLVELFMACADVADGAGGPLPDDVAEVYADAMQDADVREFYGALCDDRHAEVFGDE